MPHRPVNESKCLTGRILGNPENCGKMIFLLIDDGEINRLTRDITNYIKVLN